ncbi:MAG TPA: signal peptidase I [Steroidobacteraceae bacterium]|nr:signal peptidase I [Steroidobacteraceae bacterium]
MSDGDSLFTALVWACSACLVVIVADGWFFRPKRDPGAISTEDPLVPRLAEYLLVALAVAMLWRMFRAEPIDFSLMLVAVGALSGTIWLVDAIAFARARNRAAAAAGTPAERVREPIAVEYARSFFPVILLVLAIRSFLFEPFRIPSDSMMPTLLDGDFIFVSKYSYGLRLPVTNTLLVPTGSPQRGDVIVFRLPPNPKINYIKRLVGLPGDRIRVDEQNHVYINGVAVPLTPGPPYRGPKQDQPNYADAATAYEQLGAKRHLVMFSAGYPKTGEWAVPQGYYFFMGDNRNNSKDSRFTGDMEAPGFVPAQNLVGKALRIWLNFDTRDGPLWRRIGSAIE